MLGYYRAPDVTSSVIDKDGWYSMGDLAKFDEGGILAHHGTQEGYDHPQWAKYIPGRDRRLTW